MRKLERHRRLAASCLLVAAVACGNQEARQASGPSMSGKPAQSAASAATEAPQIDSVQLVPAHPTAGEPVRAVVATTPSKAPSLRFEFDWSLAGRPLGDHGDKVMLTDARKGDWLEVRVVATLGQRRSDRSTHRVRLGNRVPKIDGLTFQPLDEMRAGRVITAQPAATDADGDRLKFRYEWFVNGELRDDTGPAFSTDGMKRGDRLSVSVVASDGESESDRFDSPDFKLANAAPVIVSEVIPARGEAGFEYRLPASDPDGDRLRFTLREGPEGMSITSHRGEIVWHPTPNQIGTHRVMVEVDDLHGGSTTHGFTLTVGDPNQTPAAPAD